MSNKQLESGEWSYACGECGHKGNETSRENHVKSLPGYRTGPGDYEWFISDYYKCVKCKHDWTILYGLKGKVWRE